MFIERSRGAANNTDEDKRISALSTEDIGVLKKFFSVSPFVGVQSAEPNEIFCRDVWRMHEKNTVAVLEGNEHQ